VGEAVGPGTVDLDQVGGGVRAERGLQPAAEGCNWIIPRVGGLEVEFQAPGIVRNGSWAITLEGSNPGEEQVGLGGGAAGLPARGG
jgi:hypothetical protein